MAMNFNENFAPLTDLIMNPGCVVKTRDQESWPVLLTSLGRIVANVGQSVACPTLH